MTEDELKERVVKNAIDFLEHAIDDFPSNLKYSIINFCTAVELFLKARLLCEHWSLVVSKDPDRKKFESGDFHSVTFEEACARLQKIVQSEVPENARRNFNAIRIHRNKMVHFFHNSDQSDESISEIAKEQLLAWYNLNRLLTRQWNPLFSEFDENFYKFEAKLAKHRDYLIAKFEDLKPIIDNLRAKGIAFQICHSCKFEAAEIKMVLGDLFASKCLLCNYHVTWLNYECSNCENRSILDDGSHFVCEHCGHEEEEESIAKQFNQFVTTKDNYFEAKVPANCSECEGYHTVIEYEGHYLCVRCFAVDNDLNLCNWCSEFNNGDMEDSYLLGCSVCEGHAGHHRDD
jgi:hypothetical protein